jgi:hypothetical protein
VADNQEDLPGIGTELPTAKAVRRYKRVCETCGSPFESRGGSARWCLECRAPRLCKCGCGGKTSSGFCDYIHGHANSDRKAVGRVCKKCAAKFVGYMGRSYCDKCRNPDPVFCMCGCGQMASPGKRFSRGHNAKRYAVTCKLCGTAFLSHLQRTQYCPKCGGCRNSLTRKRRTKLVRHICKVCAKEFFVAATFSTRCPECKAPKLCKCGCGKSTSSGLYDYVIGHYNSSVRNNSRVCVSCGKNFLTDSVNGMYCPDCKAPKPCKCGCGEMTKNGFNNYIVGHFDVEARKDGKICLSCGTAFVGANKLAKYCGACRSPVLKVSEGFYNSWETRVADQLLRWGFAIQLRNGALYEDKKSDRLIRYSPMYYFGDGSWFYPDFVFRELFIEITGLAYGRWPNLVTTKFKRMVREGRNLVIITNPEAIVRLRRDFACPILNIYDLEPLLPFLVQEDTEERNKTASCLNSR